MKRALSGFTLLSTGLFTLSLFSACALDEGGDGELEEIDRVDDLTIAKQATAEYADIANAEADGWGDSGLPCIEGQSIHLLNPSFLGSIDPATPAALMYDFVDGEGPRLIALEWIVPIADPANPPPAPTLFGETFHGPSSIPDLTFFGLHAWVWMKNPDGTFADTNPKVTCFD